jgi:hypothetical protein
MRYAFSMQRFIHVFRGRGGCYQHHSEAVVDILGNEARQCSDRAVRHRTGVSCYEAKRFNAHNVFLWTEGLIQRLSAMNISSLY